MNHDRHIETTGGQAVNVDAVVMLHFQLFLIKSATALPKVVQTYKSGFPPLEICANRKMPDSSILGSAVAIAGGYEGPCQPKTCK